MTTKNAAANDWATFYTEATNIDTTDERLNELATIANSYYDTDEDQAAQLELRRRIARHPNASLLTLSRICHGISHDLLANPILPLLPLEHPEFLQKFYWTTLSDILRCVEVPPSFAAACQSHTSPIVANNARYHICLTGDVDESEDWESEDWESEATELLLQLPLSDIEELFDFVETGTLPYAFTERIGLAAVHEPEPPDEYRLFTKRIQDAEKLRAKRKAGKKPPAPMMPEGGWDKLLEETPQALHTIALDPDLPEEAFRVLARNAKDKKLRQHLARNPFCPSEALAEILRYNTAERLASHPNTTPEILKAIVQKYRHGDALSAVAANPRTEPKVLEAILDPAAYTRLLAERTESSEAEDDDDEETPVDESLPSAPNMSPLPSAARDAGLARRLARRHPALAGRPWISYEDLPPTPHEYMIWARDFKSFIITATMPQSAEMQEKLTNEYEGAMRLATALNRTTSITILERLATEDGHRLVRAAARMRLANPDHRLLGL